MKRIRKRLAQIIGGITILTLAVSLVSISVVQARGNGSSNDKVKICHSTSSHSNPYVENEPDKSGDLNGHVGHTGGVYPADPWGDIIPPFDYQVWEKVGSHEECPSSNSAYSLIRAPGKTCHKIIGKKLKFAYPITVDDYDWVTHNFPGMNWTTEGQAIWNNDCNVPTPSPSPSPSPSCTPTPSPSPSETPEPSPSPSLTPTPTPSPAGGTTTNIKKPKISPQVLGTQAPVEEEALPVSGADINYNWVYYFLIIGSLLATYYLKVRGWKKIRA